MTHGQKKAYLNIIGEITYIWVITIKMNDRKGHLEKISKLPSQISQIRCLNGLSAKGRLEQFQMQDADLEAHPEDLLNYFQMLKLQVYN